MSEDFATPPHQAPPQRTGNAAVDEVLDRLESLDQLPVSDHVAVFEQAHDRLRAALEDAGGDGSSA